MLNKYSVVLVTTKNQAQAKKISKILLKKHYVACINIVPKILSLYWWENKIVEDNESLLIIKTFNKHINKIIKSVNQNHSYSVPEIISLPIIKGNIDYLKWIDRVCHEE